MFINLYQILTFGTGTLEKHIAAKYGGVKEIVIVFFLVLSSRVAHCTYGYESVLLTYC